MSLVMAAGVLFAGVVLNRTKYVNAAVTAGEKYSQKDEGNIVLSVEKVGILSTGDDYLTDNGAEISDYNTLLNQYNSASYPFKKALYTNQYAAGGTNETINQLYVDNIRAKKDDESNINFENNEYPSYYFKDIELDVSNKKTVYHSGDYIMLDNSLKTKNGHTYYYNPAIKAYDADGEVDMAEGVLFSFGSYMLGSKTDADNNILTDLVRNTQQEAANYTYAKNIQQINVSATLNGNQIVLPVVRQYGNNNYQDFTYIIPQRKGFDGHYEFVVEYRHNEEFKRQTFTFDLVFKSTYTEPEIFGSGYAYATMPKLELPVSGTTSFNLGSSKNYPTLTYDFSKYTLDYTHTLNGVVTTYSYRRVAERNILGRVNYKLVCTITDSTGTKTKTLGLEDETKAVLMFTEIGSYKFDYDYIYNGEQNSMGFSLKSDQLTIYGFELKYSKVGFNEAQMRYLTISKNSNDKVVLLVPNGYEKGEETDEQNLGVVYSVETNNEKGNIESRTGIVTKTQDAQVGYATTSTNPYNPLEGITKESYQTTNQGGIWLSSNVNYVENGEDNSYYYFDTKPILESSLTDLEKTKIENTTTFNKVGYYLVVIKVKITEANQFYQVFAFRYSNETTNIEVNALTVDKKGDPILVDGETQYTTPIGSGKFTRQNVKISWVEPDVFERSIVVKYYSIKNVYLARYDSDANGTGLLTSSQLRQQVVPVEVKNGDIFGSNIGENEGASYLLESTNEGEAKAYRSFTIDRTKITGVSMYAVETRAAGSNNNFYQVSTDQNGYYNKITAISDGYASIYWNNKVSGAIVNATYYFTPILKDSTATVSDLAKSASTVWFTNKYKLGSETGPFKINKPEQLDYTISAADVLKNCGIYFFELIDEAGNSCKFMYICDTTEQYFKIDDKYLTKNSVVYANNVSIEFATHKAIELFGTDKENPSNTEQMIERFANKQSSSEIQNAGYYVGTDSNLSALMSLFNISGANNYLTVKNEIFTAYDTEGTRKATLTVSKSSATHNPYYLMDKANKNENSSSYVLRINLYGENQFGYKDKKTQNDSNSFVIVEINDDHSLGMVYFADDQDSLTSGADFANRGKRLYTGNNILGAHATSSKVLAFYWEQGIGEYEIESIEYTYYPTPSSYNNSDLFFYSGASASKTLFKKGSTAETIAETSKNYALINLKDGQTEEGLYVVTRTYVDKDTNTKGEKKNYYFIVDRQSAITDNNKDYTYIYLKEETKYELSESFGQKEQELIYFDTDGFTEIERIKYKISLKTNKVPAQIKVPVGKYFNGTQASYYYAGRLNVKIYFYDRNEQLGKSNGTTTLVKLFDSNEYANSLGGLKDNYYKDISKNEGYLEIDLDSYLPKKVKDKYIISGNESSWLWLPGDYVIVVEDNVESMSASTAAHKKAFAFTIETEKLPTTDVFATMKEQDTIENATAVVDNNNTYTLTTKDEFVKLILPKYDNKNTQAQVDQDYLVITRTINGRTETYLRYEYSHKAGVTLPDKDANGVRTIFLPTELVRNGGKIDLNNSAKQIEYKVYIRFKVGSSSSGENEKYINCYQCYVDGKLQQYYQNCYTIIIDRIPPTANTQALETADNLVGYYNQQNGSNSMLELAVLDTSSGLYFTNQLAKYYQDKKPANLYAFVVNNNTAFNKTDIAKLYYREMGSISNESLNLPVVNFANYTQVNNVSTLTTYSFIGESNSNKYFELIEIDAAGNQNQYVILYSPKVENLTFEFSAKYMGENGEIETGMVKLDNNTSDITLFEMQAVAGGVDNLIDKFYHIELSKSFSGNPAVFNTNAETNFTNTGVTAQILESIRLSGKGNYNLKVVSRNSTVNYTINYYDQNNRVELNVRNLVQGSVASGFKIYLDGANVEQDGILYYAKEIKIIETTAGVTKTTTYNCKLDKNSVWYEDGNGKKVENLIQCNASTTYQIAMVDAFGVSSIYRFNTAEGDIFHSIKFEGATEENNKYIELANRYYAFTAATLKYNSAIYKKLILSYRVNGQTKVDFEITDGNKVNGIVQSVIRYQYSSSVGASVVLAEIRDGEIVLLPFKATEAGAIVDYKIELWDGDIVEYTYNIKLDTATNSVTLKNTDNVQHKLDFKYNEEYKNVSFSSVGSGIMNLMWTPVENEYFNYSYTLHEKLADDNVEDFDLAGLNSKVINTKETSKGVYWFEVRISTKDGKFLGNKVYAFCVLPVLTDLYYVQTDDMVAIKANSSFKFTEYQSLKTLAEEQLRLAGEDLTLPITNIPLFISNKGLTVVVAEEQGAKYKQTSVQRFGKNGADFAMLKLYRVYTSTYSRYLATLEIVETDYLASSAEFSYDKLKDNNTTETKNDSISQFVTSIYIANNKTLKLKFNQTNADSDNITKKNSIVLKVYHNGKDFETVQLNNQGKQVEYEIKGGGKYSFEIYDLSGNRHTFAFGESTSEIITVNVMKNVYFTMNGNAPINNAVFNEAVELSVYEPFNYALIDNQKPITIEVTRNGAKYDYEQKSYTYIFKDYGNYKVTFKATYIVEDGNKTINQQLISSVSFSIINKNEARSSYDLTNVSRYNILSVKNQNGKDITDAFLELISPQSQNGRLLTYQTVISNAAALDITAGKQSFEVIYQVNDGIYPARQAVFGFTLNDEIPTIECSVELGKETTKGFDITFNPGIIYEQVGDSALYINDKLICEITENSSFEKMTHSISQKTDGAGDYYVKLVGSSGSVVTSFKVVVKEPLNIWAIIIIVVVSVIVVGVTITIIVLRNKMRIR